MFRRLILTATAALAIGTPAIAHAENVDAKTVLAIESDAKPAPRPVRALEAQTVKHLRRVGFPVSRPKVVYARHALGAAEAYVRGPGQVVVLPRAQRGLTMLAKCVRKRLSCSTSPAAMFAAETLIHETLHTIWTGTPELSALPEWAFDSYGEGVVEAVTIDVLPSWYRKIARERIPMQEPMTYMGETVLVQDVSVKTCGVKWGARHDHCAQRFRADLLRAKPSEWVRLLG